MEDKPVADRQLNDPVRTPEEVLANSRRVSRDNADIAVKAMGMLAECQQGLEDLVEVVGKAHSFSFKGCSQCEAVVAARDLLAKQKETKLYN